MEEHVRPDILYDITEELGREMVEQRDSLGVNDELTPNREIAADVCDRDFGHSEPAGDIPMDDGLPIRDIPIQPMPEFADVEPDPLALDDQGCFVNNPI